MAKCGTVSLVELKRRLPAKVLGVKIKGKRERANAKV